MRIRRILVNMALSKRTQASRAVLHSILALASYHRGNNHAFAAQMKCSALQALLDAIGPEIDASAAIEHIAAGIILCIVEVSILNSFKPNLIPGLFRCNKHRIRSAHG